MSEDNSLLTTLVAGWRERQGYLIDAIRPLQNERLALRAAPHLRSLGESVAHLIATRAEWFHTELNEGDSSFAAFIEWDKDKAVLRTAAELVGGLEISLQVIEAAIARWTAAELTVPLVELSWEGKEYKLPRQWVMWHVLEHDLIQCGEISLTLGMYNLGGIAF